MSFINMLAFDNLVQILDAGLGAKGKSIGEVLDLLHGIEVIYYSINSKFRNTVPFVNERILKLMMSYLGFNLKIRVPSPLSTTRLWGVLQLNHLGVESYRPWGYYLLKSDEVIPLLKIFNLEGDCILGIPSIMHIVKGYYLIVLTDLISHYEIFVYYCNPKTSIIESMGKIVNMGTINYVELFNSDRIHIHITNSGDGISMDSYLIWYNEKIRMWTKQIRNVIFDNFDIKDYNYVISTMGYGIDIVLISKDEIRETLFCAQKSEGHLIVKWKHEDYPIDILDYIVIFHNKVYDLVTGKLLIDVSRYRIFIDDDNIISGVTRIPDNTGYYLWLNTGNTYYEILFSIEDRLKSEGKYNEIIHGEELKGYPEVSFRIGARDPRETNMSIYYTNAKIYIPEYNYDLPFPVYSVYSLFPYFYYRCTGKYGLVIIIDKIFEDRIIVHGYSINGKRIFRKYLLRTISETLEKAYSDFGKSNFIFLTSENENILDKWYSFMLSKDSGSYIASNKEDKIKMICNAC